LMLLTLWTAFRFVYAALTGTTNDEAHYWQWSRHPQWGYFDQGPGIAFVIRLGTAVFGHTTLGVRFVPVLLATATGALLFETARRWFGGRVALWTLVLMVFAPLLAVGGIVATYDNPQVFCWAAALYGVTRAVQDDRPGWWYAVGAATGLGLLTKLTMILIAPCVLVFLLLSPAYRKHLATPHPWLAFVLTLLLWTPLLYWNATNEWANFRHAAALNSRSQGAPPLRWFGEFLGGQALVVSPLLFLAELYVLGRMAGQLRGATLGEKERFAFAFSAPIIGLCLLIALRSKMEANWPAPAHLAGLLAVAVWFDGLWERGKRAGIVAAVGLSALMVGILLFPQSLPALGLKVDAFTAQKPNETYGWPEVTAGLQAARARLAAEGKPVFLAGVNYRVPSLMAFLLPDHPETVELFFDTRRDQYFFWTDPARLVGQNAVLCVDDDKKEAVEIARRYFASVETLPPILVYRPGFLGPVKYWRVHLCRDFKGYDPTAHVKGW
jgi:hypothetical protein